MEPARPRPCGPSPTIVPATLASYSVVGEREQSTLEPVLTTLSARSSDVRVAQQLGTLASLPPLALAALLSLGVIHASITLALGLGAALLLVDAPGWRIVSVMFDRERLVTGTGS